MAAQSERWSVTTARKIAERTAVTLKEDMASLDQMNAAGALARGRVFARARYYNDAIESFKEALCYDPGTHEAAARLILTLLGVGRREEALNAAVKLAADAPDYSMQENSSEEKINVFTLLGDVLARSGRTEDAMEAYEVARKKDKSDSTAAARLAQLYLATGKTKEAMTLAPRFEKNARFHDLTGVLSLAKTSEALLPRYDAAAIIAGTIVGRPFNVHGDARLAPVVEDQGAWCASIDELA
jgi:tetratricopeptide (TPR) repeat protein